MYNLLRIRCFSPVPPVPPVPTPADVRSIISLSCVRGDGQPGIQCQLSCLLTGTWLGPGPCYRSHDLAPCVILQLPSHSHQSLPSQAPVQPIREQSSQHLTVGFHCVRAGLVWSLVMGDYSIPGSPSVCVTGESSLPLPLLCVPSVFYCSHKLQIRLTVCSVGTEHQQVDGRIVRVWICYDFYYKKYISILLSQSTVVIVRFPDLS